MKQERTEEELRKEYEAYSKMQNNPKHWENWLIDQINKAEHYEGEASRLAELLSVEAGRLAKKFREIEINSDARRIAACFNACAGIRTESLESGLIKHLLDYAYMMTLNPLLPNPQRKQDMTYLGKPVYEENFKDGENASSN